MLAVVELGQALLVGALASTQAVEHAVGETGIDDGGALVDASHRIDQLVTIEVLEDEACSAGIDCCEECVVVAERGQHQGADVGGIRTKGLTNLHAVAVGQDDVDERHVGTHPDDAAGTLVDRARLADHVDVVLGRKDVSNTSAHHFVIVEHEHCDRHLSHLISKPRWVSAEVLSAARVEG